MRLQSATRVRPTRTTDGEGGFTEDWTRTQAIYIAVEYHATTITGTVRKESDVLIGDQIELDGAWYRVTDMSGSEAAHHKELTLERTAAPVNPNVP